MFILKQRRLVGNITTWEDVVVFSDLDKIKKSLDITYSKLGGVIQDIDHLCDDVRYMYSASNGDLFIANKIEFHDKVDHL